jgi:pimeloyl-ACP methyl ester carboxylesterase
MILLLLLPGLAFALIAAGVLYQAVGGRLDRKRHFGDGRCINIGEGQKLYLREKGTGSPAVIFESGIAATSLNWRRIQDAVSGMAHTVSYDRAGLGWSGPCRTSRTPTNVASELRNLLRAAGIQPPYVLVGHSFGGLVMRRYALCYPEDVAGVVLVDPMRIEEWPPLDAAKQAALDRGKRMTRYAVPIARLGLARLAVTSLLCGSGRVSRWLTHLGGDNGRLVMGRLSGEISKFPKEILPVMAAHWSRPTFYHGVYWHMVAVPDTVREIQTAGPICDVPVTLLTPGRATALTDRQLQQIGNHVRQFIAPASAHWIHLDEPELVIDAIRSMVQASTQHQANMLV